MHDPLGTVWATAAFKFHLDLHPHKEERHLFPLFGERLSLDEQIQATGPLRDAIPRDRFGDFVTWLFPLADADDQETVTRFFQQMMPPPVFDGILATVRAAFGDDYAELERRIPELRRA